MNLPADAESTDVFDILMHAILACMIVTGPIIMGGVAPVARYAAMIAALAMAGLWVLQAARKGIVRLPRTWALLTAAVFAGLLLLQVIPLPASLLAFLSAGTAATREMAGESTAGTISLSPFETRAQIGRLFMLAIVFMVAAHLGRSRRHAGMLVFWILIVALFECMYGFGEQFSGRRHIFWHARDTHLNAVTGTYWNKNHFSGLLEMALPAGLGLLLGILPRESVGKTRSRMIAALSSPRFQAPILLGAALVILAAGICFSLSRAGIMCASAAGAALLIAVALSLGFRRYTVALLIVMGAIFALVVTLGTEVIVERVEDVASGRSASWMDRLDMARSGIAMSKEFPLFGAGLGSFRNVFERFQSARFGNRINDYLHNDWLQLLTETGMMGLSLALGTAFILWRGTLRAGLARQNPFGRWMTLGCLCGVTTMLLHSFFDFNLLKVTGNAIIFAAIFGLAFSTARNKSGSENAYKPFALVLGSRTLRLSFAVPALALIAIAAISPLKNMRGEIAFNRFLAGSGISHVDYHFFFPLDSERWAPRAEEQLQCALALSPGNPRYHYFAALYAAERAESVSREQAQTALMQWVAAGADPAEIAALADNSSVAGTAERFDLLHGALKHIRTAIAGVPSAARYHLLEAQLRNALVETDASQRDAALASAHRTVALAPTRPETLFLAGEIILQAHVVAPDDDLLDEGVRCLRQAVLGEPAYAARAYPLSVALLGEENRPYLAVTPRTLQAYWNLAQALWDARKWEELLDCLDTLDQICDEKTPSEQLTPWTLSNVTESDGANAGILTEDGMAGSTLDGYRRAIAQRRAAVLGILGRWEERQEAVGRYRHLLRISLADDIEGALRLQASDRIEDAYAAIKEVLAQDWSNPEALLLAAELADRLDIPSIEPEWESAADHLFRIIIWNEHLEESVLTRMREIASRKERAGMDEVVADFAEGAACILADRDSEGIELLRRLSARADESAQIWPQRHLVWYYLGLGYEKSGMPDEAAKAYRRAIELVPAHWHALEALARLGDARATEALRSLTPETQLDSDFSGRITLLGINLETEGAGTVEYLWEFRERIPSDYGVGTNIFDDEWQPVGEDTRSICRDEKAYPIARPRCGEVLQERRVITIQAPAKYIMVHLWTPYPVAPLHSQLLTSNGEHAVRGRLPDVPRAPGVAAAHRAGGGRP